MLDFENDVMPFVLELDGLTRTFIERSGGIVPFGGALPAEGPLQVVFCANARSSIEQQFECVLGLLRKMTAKGRYLAVAAIHAAKARDGDGSEYDAYVIFLEQSNGICFNIIRCVVVNSDGGFTYPKDRGGIFDADPRVFGGTARLSR